MTDQKKTRNDKEGQEKWHLITEVSGFKINYNQYLLSKEISVRLEKLIVTDNSGDERFPCIFDNTTDGDQKELVDISVIMIDPSDPLYKKVETDVILKFGGLNINYKP